MIPAYNKLYLENTRKNLGRLFDYVTYDLKIDLSDFISMFLKTKISKSIEKGIIKYCVGMSGIELSYHILDEFNYKYQKVKPTFMINKSVEYWCFLLKNFYISSHRWFAWSYNLRKLFNGRKSVLFQII